MTAHTAGPWEVHHSEYGASVRSSEGADVAWCGETISSEHGVSPYKANARLIAAAPETTEALELMLGLHDCDCDFCRMAHKALAKAKGKA